MAHRHSWHKKSPLPDKGGWRDHDESDFSRHDARHGRHNDHDDHDGPHRSGHGRHCTKAVDDPEHWDSGGRDDFDARCRGASHREHHGRKCDPHDDRADTHASNHSPETLADAIDDLLPCVRSLGRCLPKEEDTTDLSLSLLGTADAVGIDTNADGDLFARVVDKGNVSVAYGYSAFSALAETTGDDLAFASAFTDAFASGADFIISWTRHLSVTLQSEDGQFAKDVSSTFIMAIDIEAWDFRDGPIVIDGDKDRSFAFDLDNVPDLIAAGNLANFKFDVEAVGENTFADVAFSVFSVEDQLSTVSATADLGVA